METAIYLPIWLQYVLAGLTVVASAFGFWKYVEGKIMDTKNQLDQHKADAATVHSKFTTDIGGLTSRTAVLESKTEGFDGILKEMRDDIKQLLQRH